MKQSNNRSAYANRPSPIERSRHEKRFFIVPEPSKTSIAPPNEYENGARVLCGRLLMTAIGELRNRPANNRKATLIASMLPFEHCNLAIAISEQLISEAQNHFFAYRTNGELVFMQCFASQTELNKFLSENKDGAIACDDLILEYMIAQILDFNFELDLDELDDDADWFTW